MSIEKYITENYRLFGAATKHKFCFDIGKSVLTTIQEHFHDLNFDDEIEKWSSLCVKVFEIYEPLIVDPKTSIYIEKFGSIEVENIGLYLREYLEPVDDVELSFEKIQSFILKTLTKVRASIERTAAIKSYQDKKKTLS